MLPIGFLRQLISMYGNSMQAMMPQYLEASMENFRANQQKLQDAFKSSVGPEAFSRLAETNMAMFKAAASAFIPKGAGRVRQPIPSRRASSMRCASRWRRCSASSTSLANSSAAGHRSPPMRQIRTYPSDRHSPRFDHQARRRLRAMVPGSDLVRRHGRGIGRARLHGDQAVGLRHLGADAGADGPADQGRRRRRTPISRCSSR